MIRGYIALDLNSGTWATVEAEAQAILKACNAQLIQQGVDERSSDFDRGQIHAAARILRLAQTAAPASQQSLSPEAPTIYG